MKQSLGAKAYLYPMPVLVIGTYNDDGTPDAMTMAWGGVCDFGKVALNLEEEHLTSDNVKKHMAFTLAIADSAHIAEADYVGTVSGKKVPDKVAKCGLHAVKSAHVDAPVFEEFPLTLECKVLELQHGIGGFRVLGEIVNTLADPSILGADGEIDSEKVDAAIFDTAHSAYYRTGEKLGTAWEMGSGQFGK